MTRGDLAFNFHSIAPPFRAKPNLTKRPRLILILLAVLAVGCVLFVLLLPGEPVYKSKKLSEWMYVTLGHRVDVVGGNLIVDESHLRAEQEARLAIRAIGTNGFLTIRRMLRAQDGSLWRGLKKFVNGHTVFRVHLHTDEEKVHAAAQAVATLGTDALPLLPDLIRLAQDPDARFREHAMNTLVVLMKQDIAGIEPHKRALLSLLSDRCGDTNSIVRQQALKAISLLKDQDKDLLRAVWIEQHTQEHPDTNTPTTPK